MLVLQGSDILPVDLPKHWGEEKSEVAGALRYFFDSWGHGSFLFAQILVLIPSAPRRAGQYQPPSSASPSVAKALPNI